MLPEMVRKEGGKVTPACKSFHDITLTDAQPQKGGAWEGDHAGEQTASGWTASCVSAAECTSARIPELFTQLC